MNQAHGIGKLTKKRSRGRGDGWVRKTVVIVTHDMAEAFALGTRVGVLDGGVIAEIDEPRRLARSTDPRVRPLLEPLLEARAILP